jgi:cyclohexanone monooxygenase
VECSQQAQDEWVTTIHATAVDNTQFQRECTPGYYNNEGEAKIRWFLGEPYGKGFYAFDKLIRQWRERGDMQGLVLGSAESSAAAQQPHA